VLGADGFGYRTQNGRHVKVPQLGHVEIGDDCEIGACTTIDRGTFAATRVGEGTKIDNLVQIGHNCQIGRIICSSAQMGIAGSSSTGDYVVVAGQAGIVDPCTSANEPSSAPRLGSPRRCPPGYACLARRPRRNESRNGALMTMERLPEMRKDIQRINSPGHVRSMTR